LGLLDNVLLYCQQCLEIDPVNETAYQKRAQVFLLLGNLSEARADLEVALRINPGDQWVSEELKYVKEQMMQRVGSGKGEQRYHREANVVAPIGPERDGTVEVEENV
jgi:tetratricopeptide (TPR) repeat protein